MDKPNHPATPKRILFVENGIGYGGAIICLRHLVRNLDRGRYTPLVVTGRTGPQYREISQDAAWKYIRDRHFDIVAVRAGFDKRKWIRRVPGLRTILNQIVSRLDDLLNFLPFFTRLLVCALRFRPDLVHANNEPLCNRAALLVGAILRVPIVCHVRGDQRGSKMMGWVYRLPDHFIAVSAWVSEGIGRLGIAPERRSVIFDGIELDRLDHQADGGTFRRRHAIPDDAFAVGLVGLLMRWKGQEIFLDAAQILRAHIPNLRMLIIGGTPDDCAPFERRLRDRVAGEDLEGIVTFTGHATDMDRVYNALDVVVSASISPEPLGTVVIESMAMGRPLVAPNHGGAAEMAEDGHDALLFNPGDAASLADAILRLYRSEPLRVELGTRAREKALRRFSVALHTENVQRVYQRLLQ